MAGSVEHGNEPLVSIKCWEIDFVEFISCIITFSFGWNYK
jgi:hypothetical protein